MSNTRYSNWSVVALSVSVSMLAAGCSLIGGDDAVVASELDAAETTAVAETPAEEETDTDAPVADDDPKADLVDEEGRRIGRTGPIRELPGLSQWADLDLKPFLMEVMLFPEEVPIPDNAILTWVSVRQQFTDEGSSSRDDINARFQPLFSMDEFKTLMSTLSSDSGWTAAGVDEDLEEHSIRLEFTNDGSSSSLTELFVTYTDGDTSEQAELSLFASGDFVVGRTEVVVNEALFPWVNEIVVDPAMVNYFVTYDIGRLTGKAELDRRWEAPSTDFERLSDFYRAPTGAGFVADSEMEYEETVWPWNEIQIVREDGFDGDITVSQSDPEDEVSVLIGGWYVLE